MPAPASEPVLEQDTAPAPATEVDIKALLEQTKTIIKQNDELVKKNSDLAASLEESKFKLDQMTRNAMKLKKSYITEKKAVNRKHEQVVASLDAEKATLNDTRQQVDNLNAAMYFVLDKDHQGKYFDKVSCSPLINIGTMLMNFWVQLWGKIREWTRY